MTPTRFTIAYGCLFVVALMPYVCAILAKRFGAQVTGARYDNARPREWLARLTGWPARANAAQANCFEAMPFFFAAVIIAQQRHAIQGPLDMLCAMFVVCRVLYVLMYVADMHLLRSLMWFLAFGLNVAIFFWGF